MSSMLENYSIRLANAIKAADDAFDAYQTVGTKDPQAWDRAREDWIGKLMMVQCAAETLLAVQEGIRAATVEVPTIAHET